MQYFSTRASCLATKTELGDLRRTPLPSGQAMDACIHGIGSRFFAGCAGVRIGLSLFATLPYLSRFANYSICQHTVSEDPHHSEYLFTAPQYPFTTPTFCA